MKAWAPKHPFAIQGYVAKHRLVMEGVVGAVLPRSLQVHHKDGNPKNNTPENLQIVTPSQHGRIHAGWECRNGEWFKKCGDCEQVLPVNTHFYRRLTGFQHACKECCKARNRAYKRANSGFRKRCAEKEVARKKAKRALGICAGCNEKAVTKIYCLKCAVRAREWNRRRKNAQEKHTCKTRRLEAQLQEAA